MILVFLIAHSLIWFGLLGFAFLRNINQMPRLVASRKAVLKKSPKVSVLIPARDEEIAIRDCIESLMAQDFENFEVIVANDRSVDRTGEILKSLQKSFGKDRLKIIDVPEPPDGWMGKCHALYNAYQEVSSDSEWLLFMDADVKLQSDTLRRAVYQSCESSADLAVVFPHLVCESFWENAILPVFMHLGVISMRPRKIQEAGNRDFIGIGAFTLLNRKMYDQFGGHEAIRGEVIDDMALGMMTKDFGGSILLLRGRKAVYLRMYDSLWSIITGFQKNAHAGIGGGLLRSVFASGIILFLHLLPLLSLIISILTQQYLLGGFAALIYVLTGIALYQRLGQGNTYKPWQAILGYSLGSIVCVYIILRSAWYSCVKNEIHWRGRVLDKPEQKVKLFP